MQLIPLVVLPSMKEYIFARECRRVGRDRAAEKLYLIKKRDGGSVARIAAIIQSPGIQAALAGVLPLSLRTDQDAT